MPRAKLKVQIPGVTAAPAAPFDPATVPESFLAEIATLDNEGLIALDTAERSGENRDEYLAAIDAELRTRIAPVGQGVVAEHAEDLKALSAPEPAPRPVARLGLPSAAGIDPSTITTPVLTTEGWVVPSTATPPPIR